MDLFEWSTLIYLNRMKELTITACRKQRGDVAVIPPAPLKAAPGGGKQL
jgi:hypothetical protein